MDHPNSFQIAFRELSPCQIAVSAHQAAKEFRMVSGMEHNQTHALKHTLLDAVDQSVTNLGVGKMSPPKEYIGIVENFFAETFIRIVKAARTYHETLVFYALRNRAVNTPRVNPGNIGMKLLMAAFIPDGYLDGRICFHFSFLDKRWMDSGFHTA